MKKLIIFDLDETLTKTGECYDNVFCSSISERYNKALSEIKKIKLVIEKELSVDSSIKNRRQYYDALYEKFLQKLGKEVNEETLLEFDKVTDDLNNRYAKEIELFDGVLENLQKLKEKGFLLAILTGSHSKLKAVYDEDYVLSRRKRLLETFKTTGLDKVIDEYFFAWDHKCMKPDKEAFYLPLNHFNIEPENAIMVGDKDKDMKAKEFGLKTILFDPKGKYKKDTIPDYKVKSFNNMLDVIDKIEF